MAETTHSYLDWQISTLMLAHDVADPIKRHDTARLTQRQQAVEKEVHDIAMSTIPSSYRENPKDDFPPEIVTLLTRATLRRAAEIAIVDLLRK
jgi:hypothetical protein